MLAEVADSLNVQTPEPEREKPVVKSAEKSMVHISTAVQRLSLDMAKKIAGAVEKAAKIMGVRVVAAVVNDGANLICLEAMDDSYIASVRAAQDKAYTAAALKMPTYKALEESRGGGLDGLTNGNGILLLAGGEPLFVNGKLLGAVGVSGGTKEQDAILAMVAAEVFGNLI